MHPTIDPQPDSTPAAVPAAPQDAYAARRPPIPPYANDPEMAARVANARYTAGRNLERWRTTRAQQRPHQHGGTDIEQAVHADVRHLTDVANENVRRATIRLNDHDAKLADHYRLLDLLVNRLIAVENQVDLHAEAISLLNHAGDD